MSTRAESPSALIVVALFCVAVAAAISIGLHVVDAVQRRPPAPRDLLLERLTLIEAHAARLNEDAKKGRVALEELRSDVGRLAALLKLQANRPVRVEQPQAREVAQALDHLRGMLAQPLVCQCQCQPAPPPVAEKPPTAPAPNGSAAPGSAAPRGEYRRAPPCAPHNPPCRTQRKRCPSCRRHEPHQKTRA